MDATNTVIEHTIGLLGGVLVTKRGGPLGAGDVWSYPNVHGDVMATADNVGAKQGATKTYDPYGQALGTVPDNSAGNFDDLRAEQSKNSPVVMKDRFGFAAVAVDGSRLSRRWSSAGRRGPD